MTKAYQNVLSSRTNSVFVEIGERKGEEISFTTKTNSVKRGSVSAVIQVGRVALSKTVTVVDCVNPCVTAEFQSGFALQFNVVKGDVAALDAMQAEINRVFALAKANMVHGVLPSPIATFAAV